MSPQITQYSSSSAFQTDITSKNTVLESLRIFHYFAAHLIAHSNHRRSYLNSTPNYPILAKPEINYVSFSISSNPHHSQQPPKCVPVVRKENSRKNPLIYSLFGLVRPGAKGPIPRPQKRPPIDVQTTNQGLPLRQMANRGDGDRHRDINLSSAPIKPIFDWPERVYANGATRTESPIEMIKANCQQDKMEIQGRER